MHAASRHGTPSLTSFPKDGLSELFWSFIRKVAHPVFDRIQPRLTLAKLMELAGPLGHSPRWGLTSMILKRVNISCYCAIHAII